MLMDTVPAVWMSDCGTLPVACVELTTWVVSLLPFHSTTQFELKFEPVTVRLKPAPPATTLAGDNVLLSCGTWLGASVHPSRNRRMQEQTTILAIFT